MVKFSYQLPLFYETYARWTASHLQITLTCDDMNIIQVGTRSRGVALSPAPAPQVLCNQFLCSRFPHIAIRSQGSYSRLHFVDRGGCAQGTSGSDDEEMKNPPKKVAEELGLHLVWEGPNVNETRQVQWRRGHGLYLNPN